MFPKIMKTEKDYDRVLDRINKLMDADPGIPAGDELDMLVSLVKQYEKEKRPIDPSDPVRTPRSRKW